MSPRDLQRPEFSAHAEPSECDICIVGSGPAGSTLAAELSGSRLRVVLLESGGFARSPEADALDEIESVGRRRAARQWSVRNRILGGASHTWGGRCAPFDEIDFAVRPWVPFSGWPIDSKALAPYMARTATHLGLAAGDAYADERFWALAGRSAPADDPDPALLRPFFWQFSRDPAESYPYEYVRFGRGLAGRLGENVTVVTGATVLRVDVVETGRAVSGVTYAGPGGGERTLRAHTVVLCAGGIENPRILLSSDAVVPRGLGNERDLVGRYLMDHLRGSLGEIENRGADGLKQRYGRYNIGRNFFRAGLRLSPQVQRDEQLLNCAAWLGEALSLDDPWAAMRRIAGGAGRWPQDVAAVARNASLVAQGARDYFVRRNGLPRKLDALELVCMCEQLPDPESRITLSDRRDRFGMRLARVDWRVHAVERRTLVRTAELVAAEFARLGLPAVRLADWALGDEDLPTAFVDVAHPSGATRMSADPTDGVVDPETQVHGVTGLYVTGSSVFPTVGHCNPTQSIVALAIRLADHLKAVAAAQAVPAVRTHFEPQARLGRVLVTGATGRIGRRLVADMVERGYHVRATTSKPTAPAAAAGAVEWRRFDLMCAGLDDYDELLRGCDFVAHLAAELGKQGRMQRVNVDATRLLGEAAERAGLTGFCYVSSVAVYGSGRTRVMAEDAPVLTADRDVPSEYLALDYVRAYGRTKLAGELALRRLAHRVPYVVLRPTVVVDVPQLIEIRDWSAVKRTLTAHRHAHHVYVGDVSEAIIWSIERCRSGQAAAGEVETFNLSEDDFEDATHAAFMRKAFAASGDPRWRVVAAPAAGDWLHDALRFRRASLRNPLWRMRFPNRRLLAAGFRPRFGMAWAQAMALQQLGGAALHAAPRPPQAVAAETVEQCSEPVNGAAPAPSRPSALAGADRL